MTIAMLLRNTVDSGERFLNGKVQVGAAWTFTLSFGRLTRGSPYHTALHRVTGHCAHGTRTRGALPRRLGAVRNVP